MRFIIAKGMVLAFSRRLRSLTHTLGLLPQWTRKNKAVVTIWPAPITSGAGDGRLDSGADPYTCRSSCPPSFTPLAVLLRRVQCFRSIVARLTRLSHCHEFLLLGHGPQWIRFAPHTGARIDCSCRRFGGRRGIGTLHGEVVFSAPVGPTVPVGPAGAGVGTVTVAAGFTTVGLSRALNANLTRSSRQVLVTMYIEISAIASPCLDPTRHPRAADLQ